MSTTTSPPRASSTPPSQRSNPVRRLGDRVFTGLSTGSGIAILAIPQPLEAGEALAKLRAINPSLTLLARAHSDAEVKHLLAHGADGAVMAERELAYSLAEMVMSTPPYRQLRVKM